MLDVLVICSNVCEHVMHVVFGSPPVHRKAPQESRLDPAEKVELFISVVRS